MGRRNNDLPVWKRWAAAAFFATGLGLLLLAVFGPVLWGASFDAQLLQRPALGLIGVGVYVFVGVNLPQVDWGAVLARVITALAKGDDGKGKG